MKATLRYRSCFATALICTAMSTAIWAEEDITTAMSGPVARAVFTNGINDREPVDDVTQVGIDVNQIFFFTELRGMAGQTVSHRWEYNGAVMAEVPFNVGAPRWRVWSSKKLVPAWTGEWQVSVIDANGNNVGSRSFNYGAP